MARPRTSPQPEVPGLAARKIAADILDGVLRRKIALDEQLSGKAAHPGLAALPDRDRALMRRLVATVLRRLGTLRHLLGGFLDKGFPADAPRVETILLIGAAQILWLEVPDHAAVDLSVRLAQADRARGALCRPGQRGAAPRGAEPRRRSPPPRRRATRRNGCWRAGRKTLRRRDRARDRARQRPRAGARSHRESRTPATWAERLRGRVLPTGTVRTLAQGAISLLPGFAEGAWWVQDAAAALPARLLGDVRGKAVADLCAAPGGKTAQLAFAGARVTAVDRSPARLDRLRENLARLACTPRSSPPTRWSGKAGPFDAVLLDAPCSSTGTIRRHPDVPWLKSEADIAALTSLQQRLLDRAVDLLKPGGTPGLLRLLAGAGGRRGADRRAAGARPARRPRADRSGRGRRPRRIPHRRTATCARCRRNLPDPDPRWGGLDGFYAARLVRKRPSPRDGKGILALRRPFAIVWIDARESGRAAGDERLHDAGLGRGASQALRAHRAPRVPQPGRPHQRASAAALALRLGQDRPAGDRAAGSAHRRRHPRQRNLRRPLRLRRQGGDLRPPLALRDDAAVRRMGGDPAELRLAAPPARRRLAPSPAPMRAR